MYDHNRSPSDLFFSLCVTERNIFQSFQTVLRWHSTRKISLFVWLLKSLDTYTLFIFLPLLWFSGCSPDVLMSIMIQSALAIVSSYLSHLDPYIIHIINAHYLFLVLYALNIALRAIISRSFLNFSEGTKLALYCGC